MSDLPAEQPKPEVNFHSIWLNFTLNMWALWEFCEQFSKTADQYDEKKLQDTAREIARITGEDITVIEPIYRRYLDNLPKAEYALDENGERDIQEMAGLIHSRELERIFLDLKRRNREKYDELEKWWYRFTENPPTTGPTLRQSSLLLLVSIFDSLRKTLDDTCNVGFKGEDSSIEALADFKSAIKEIDARRNVFAHCGGVIDEKYFNRSGRDIDPQLLRKRLLVSVNYINNAIEIIFIRGAILTQYYWLTRHPDQKEAAGEAFNQLLFTALIHKKYNLVIQLVETRKKMEEFPDIPKVVFVNQAIAYRKLKNEKMAASIISELKQDLSSPLINFAVAVLLRNDDKVKRLAQKCFEDNLGDHMRIDWPLFDEYRIQGWFLALISNKSSLPRPKRKR